MAKPTPTAPAISSDPATARALQAGDSEALAEALRQRGDDQPMGEQEMMAIAQVMLGGNSAFANFAAKAANEGQQPHAAAAVCSL